MTGLLYTSQKKFPKPNTKVFLLRLWVGFLVYLIGGWPTLVYALPQDGQIVAGKGNIQQPSSTNMVVNQSSEKLITNWKSFGISNQESVQFNQPGSNSVALNRVLGPNPSEILGKLSANGQVFLTNPSGIIFGQNAKVNVGGLMATTLGISNQDFLNGNYKFTQDPSKALASIINKGQIQSSGYVGLLAPNVENHGTIIANAGSVAMGSGNAASLDFNGDGLINFAITEPVEGEVLDEEGNVVEHRVLNTGKIQSGYVALTAKNASDVVKNVVNNTGVIEAYAAVEKDGEIYLMGEGGEVSVSGTLDASGKNAGEKGGTIHILGDEVELDNATIDASGEAGGGTVLVGGDYQGKGSIKTANNTQVSEDTVINADAVNQGDGGKIIIWSENSTVTKGILTARGGAVNGDGGLIETSGKNKLVVTKAADVSAKNGLAGTWLLDPRNIEITNVTSGVDQNGGEFTPNSDDSTVDVALINQALNNGTSVVITTSSDGDQEGNITVTSAILKSSGGDTSLTLNAAGKIIVNNTITSSNGKLDVNLVAKSDIDINSAITTNGGNFIANSQGQGGVAPHICGVAPSINHVSGAPTQANSTKITIGADINTNGGDVTLGDANGTQTVALLGAGIIETAQKKSNVIFDGGSINQAKDLNINADIRIEQTQNITLAATNDINFKGSVLIDPDAPALTSANLIINADSDADGSGDLIVLEESTIDPGGTVTITANDIDLQGKINASTTILVSDNGTIGLGNAAGNMTLSDAELNRITGLSLTIGSFNNGNIVVEGITLTSGSTVTLNSGGSITFQNTDSNFSALTVNANVDINVNHIINVSGDFVATADQDNNGAGNFTLASGFTLVAVNSLTVNAVNIFQNGNFSTGGTLTLNGNVVVSGAVSLTAADGIIITNDLVNNGTITIDADSDRDGTGDFTLNSGIQIVSNNNDISITANDFIINGTIDSGSGTLSLLSSVDGATIGIGDGAGDISITRTELQNITAANLIIGGSNNGNITVDGVTSAQSNNINSLALKAIADGSSVNFTNAASTFKALSVQAGNGITVDAALTTNGDLSLEASNADITLNQDISTNGGNFFADAGAEFNNNPIIHVSGVAITNQHISGSGGQSLSSNKSTIFINADINTSGGDITLGRAIQETKSLIGFGSITTSSLSSKVVFGDLAGGANDTLTTGSGIGTGTLNFNAFLDLIGKGVNTLTLGAHQNVNFNGQILLGDTDQLDLIIIADSDNNGTSDLVVGEGASLITNGGSINITAKDIDLLGEIDSGNGDISIIVSTNGSIGLGNATGTLTLDNAELSKLKGHALTLGNSSGGDIVVQGIDADLISTVTLISGGDIAFDSEPSTFINLNINSDGNIAINRDLTIQGNLVAVADADNSGTGDFTLELGNSIESAGDINITAITIVQNGDLTSGGALTLDGDVQVTETTTGQATIIAANGVTISENIIQNQNIFINADSDNDNIGDFVLNSGIRIISNDNDITIIAAGFVIDGTIDSGSGTTTLQYHADGTIRVGHQDELVITNPADPNFVPESSFKGIAGSELANITANKLEINTNFTGFVLNDIKASDTQNIDTFSITGPGGVFIQGDSVNFNSLEIDTNHQIAISTQVVATGDISIKTEKRPSTQYGNIDLFSGGIRSIYGNINLEMVDIRIETAFIEAVNGTISIQSSENGTIAIGAASGDLKIDNNELLQFTAQSLTLGRNAGDSIFVEGVSSSSSNGIGVVNLISGQDINFQNAESTFNSLTATANGNINVNANLTIDNGDFNGTADADNNNVGDFTVTGASTLFASNDVTIIAENILANGDIAAGGQLSLNGVITTSGAINLSAIDGITISDNIINYGIITINADSNNDGNGTFTLNSGIQIDSIGKRITITANDFIINGTINSGSAQTILQLTQQGNVGIGNASGNATISGAELQNITASNLTIDSNGGNISVDGITAANSGNIGRLTLKSIGTAGAITFNNANTFNSITIDTTGEVNINANLMLTSGDSTINSDIDANESGTFTVASGATINTNNNDLAISTREFVLDGNINVGDGTLVMTPSQINVTFVLGDLSAGYNIGIDNDELRRISADTFSLVTGEGSTIHNIYSGDTANINNLVFIATNELSDMSVGNSVIDSNLSISVNKQVFINFDLTAKSIEINADADGDGNGNIRHEHNRTITSTDGDITLTGNDLVMTNGSFINAAGDVKIASSSNLGSTIVGNLYSPQTIYDMFVSQSELGNISAQNLIFEGLDILINGVNLSDTAGIANTVKFQGVDKGNIQGRVKFYHNASSFKNLEAAAKLFVQVATDITTTENLSFNADNISIIPGTAINPGGSPTTSISTGGQATFEAKLFEFIMNSGASINTNGNTLDITARDIYLNGTLNSGTGDTIIRSNNNGLIFLGDAAGNVFTDTIGLNLSRSELQNITAQNLVFGDSDTTGITLENLHIEDTANIADTVTLNALADTGSINFNGLNNQNDGAANSLKSIIANANNGIVFNSQLVTTVGDIILDGDFNRTVDGADGILILPTDPENSNSLYRMRSAGDVVLKAKNGGINVTSGEITISTEDDIIVHDDFTGTNDITFYASSGSPLNDGDFILHDGATVSTVGNPIHIVAKKVFLNNGSLNIGTPTSNASVRIIILDDGTVGVGDAAGDITFTRAQLQNISGYGLRIQANGLIKIDNVQTQDIQGLVDNTFLGSQGVTLSGGASAFRSLTLGGPDINVETDVTTMGRFNATSSNQTNFSAGVTISATGDVEVGGKIINHNGFVIAGGDLRFRSEDGINIQGDIQANGDVRILGNGNNSYNTGPGIINISSGVSITSVGSYITLETSSGPINTLGLATFNAATNINIYDNLNAQGDLVFNADSNNNGTGGFTLHTGVILDSTNDITIQAANITTEIDALIKGNVLTTTTITGMDVNTKVNALNFTNTGTGDVIVDNQGGIVVTGTNPGGLVDITTHSPLTVGAAGISAGQHITLTAAGASGQNDDNLTIQGAVTSTSGNILLTADDALQANAAIFASSGTVSAISTNNAITFNDTVSSGGNLTVSAAEGVTVNSNINSNGAITINADSDSNNSGNFTLSSGQTIASSGDLAIEAEILIQEGTLDSDGEITLDGLVQVGGNIFAADGVTISQDLILDEAINIDADYDRNGTGDFTLLTGVSINSNNNDITITANDFIINGTIDSGTADTYLLSSVSGTAIGVGVTAYPIAISNTELSNITSNNLIIGNDRTSRIVVNHVNAADVANIETVIFNALDTDADITLINSSFNVLEVNSTRHITVQNNLSTTGPLTLNADRNDGFGYLSIQGGASVSTDNSDINISMKTFYHFGSLDSGSATITIKSTAPFDGIGGVGLGASCFRCMKIEKSAIQRMTAGNLVIDASSTEHITIGEVDTNDLANISGLVTLIAKDVIIFSDAEFNDLIIHSESDIVSNYFKTLTADNLTTNTVTGMDIDTQVNTLTFTNTGTGDIVVYNQGGITATGTNPGGSVDITTHSPLTVGAAGISAGQNVTLTAAGASGQNDDNLTIQGNVSSTNGNIVLTADDTLQANGTITASSGTVSATSTNDAITFNDTVSSNGDLTVTSAEGVTVNSDVNSNGAITIDADSDSNNSGDFTLSAGQIISSDGDLTIDAETMVQNGDLNSGGEITINGLSQVGGNISAADGVTISQDLILQTVS